MRKIGPSLLICAFLVAGCSETSSETSSGLEKSQAVGAKADTDLQRRVCRSVGLPADCDICQAAGWYGDGECDTFCDNPDPDCGTQCQSDADCPQIYCITTPCPFQTCQSGECKIVTPPDPDAGTAYDACAGKTCGDTCTFCDPADPNCFEPELLRACDDNGVCEVASRLQCSNSCPPRGVVCDPACENGMLPNSPGVPCEKGTWNDTTCSCDPPSSDECASDADCGAGEYCTWCWGDYACIPVGAVC